MIDDRVKELLLLVADGAQGVHLHRHEGFLFPREDLEKVDVQEVEAIEGFTEVLSAGLEAELLGICVHDEAFR